MKNGEVMLGGYLKHKVVPKKTPRQPKLGGMCVISESATALSMYDWHAQLHPPIQTFG